jgi:hypothetical protein
MTQLIINIEDKSILPHLKKILNAIEGISIAHPEKKTRKTGIDLAYDDIHAGRVNKYSSAQDLYDKFGI